MVPHKDNPKKVATGGNWVGQGVFPPSRKKKVQRALLARLFPISLALHASEADLKLSRRVLGSICRGALLCAALVIRISVLVRVDLGQRLSRHLQKT